MPHSILLIEDASAGGTDLIHAMADMSERQSAGAKALMLCRPYARPIQHPARRI